MVKLNKVRERLFYLAPAVQAGWDDESALTDFDVISMLGKGSFGIVKKVRHKKTGKIYAVKQISKKEIKQRGMIEQVRTELKIMYSLNHSNIVKLYSHFEDDVNISLILEYVEKGQLYVHLLSQPQRKFTEQEAAKFVAQVIDAVRFMHLRKIIHRDIKPENILLDADGNLKLADFGWSNFVEPFLKRMTYCGTLDYLAPEMLTKDRQHDYSVDVWAIGVLTYQLCTGQSPFSVGLSKSTPQLEKCIKENIRNMNYTIPTGYSQSFGEFVKSLLVKQPTKRPLIYELQQHPWVRTNYTPVLSVSASGTLPKPGWTDELKREFKNILEVSDKAITQEQKVFSHNQIYEYSRLESVINREPKKESPALIQHEFTGKFLDNESRIRQLEAQRAADQEEIKRLRGIVEGKGTDHTACLKKKLQLEMANANLQKQLDLMFTKLTISEAKCKDLERKLLANPSK